MSDMSMGNLYDMNKKLVLEHEQPLNHLELARKQEILEDFFNNNVIEYAMLLCHEQRDYTVFQVGKSSTAAHFAAREAIGCCTDRGEVYGIDKTDDGMAYEIWIKIDGDVYCYYLFPYDNAVIKCE